MRPLIPVIHLTAALVLAACASGGLTPAESIARLERDQRSAPQSATVNRSLGIAYYKAGRLAEARRALETASQLEPTDGTTALYLGLTAEAQNDLPTARRAYSSYLRYGRTSRVRGQLEARLVALQQKELQAEARTALAQEQSLASATTSPRTVAVLPLRYSGADTALAPLGRGLTDLLTTDLARSSQLQLVERARLQALVDELRLQQGGATDQSTNVRAGRLVRAGRVVQGSVLQVNDATVRVDAAVVDVPTARVNGSAQAADQLEQVFAIEKKLALDLFQQLGVTLTVAERNAIEQRPTRSLAAFLAYSRGLAAQDAGRYDDASRFFGEALRLDPGFTAAQQKSQESRTASAGAAVSAQTVESSLKGTTEGAVVAAATAGIAQPPGTAIGSTSGTLGGTAKETAGAVNPTPAGVATAGASGGGGSTGSQPGQKDPVSTATGSNNPTTTPKVTITIVRPRP